MKIVLISCVKKKRTEPCKAIDMYISPLFRGGVKYAKAQKPDKIYILSAKYGLLKEDTIIRPYNKCLNEYTEYEKKVWAYRVLESMKAEGLDIEKDEFIILAGNDYRKYICQKIKNYTIPLEGMSLFKQISYLSKF